MQMNRMILLRGETSQPEGKDPGLCSDNVEQTATNRQITGEIKSVYLSQG